VSSSGHLALVPRLLGWSHAELPPEARKTFDVALHAGSAPALALALRRVGLGDPRLLALSLFLPALAGLLFERSIERRLGGVRSVGGAQIVAGAALLVADSIAHKRPRRREATTPDALDHLAVGCAQAAALVPGVSRSGAALTVARLRGLPRDSAVALSLRAALPVTVAAGVLKAARARGRAGRVNGAARVSVPAELRVPLAAGAAAAAVSGLASLPLLPLLERPAFVRVLACYRVALGVAALLLHGRAGPRSHQGARCGGG
jgi:undecaprenyl-diphosphatase